MSLNMISGLITLVLLMCAFKALKDREFSLGIGRPPIVYVTLKGNFARALGATFVICAAANLFTLLVTSTTVDAPITWLIITSAGSFLVSAFTFCLLLVLQSAVALGYWLHKHNSQDVIKAKR